MTRVLTELQAFGVPSCSALSVFEVQVGVKKRRGDEDRVFLESLKVFDVTRQIANKAGALVREQRAKGLTFDVQDAMIAATCLIHDLNPVTYNKKHYSIAGLTFHPMPALS